jgi:hypothetical protein
MYNVPTQKLVLTEINETEFSDKSVTVYGADENFMITWAYIGSCMPDNLTIELVL